MEYWGVEAVTRDRLFEYAVAMLHAWGLMIPDIDLGTVQTNPYDLFAPGPAKEESHGEA